MTLTAAILLTMLIAQPPVFVAYRAGPEIVKQNLVSWPIFYWHDETHWYQSIQEMWTEPGKTGVQTKNYIIQYGR